MRFNDIWHHFFEQSTGDALFLSTCFMADRLKQAAGEDGMVIDTILAGIAQTAMERPVDPSFWSEQRNVLLYLTEEKGGARDVEEDDPDAPLSPEARVIGAVSRLWDAADLVAKTNGFDIMANEWGNKQLELTAEEATSRRKIRVQVLLAIKRALGVINDEGFARVLFMHVDPHYE